MKKNIALLAFLLSNIISYSQVFKSESTDYIDFSTKEIKLNIDGSGYKGNFQSFKSKKDKKEYLIYNYFSRTIVLNLNIPIDKIKEASPAITINSIKLIHSSDAKSIMGAVNKKGLSNIKNFIVIYDSSNCNIHLINPDIENL